LCYRTDDNTQHSGFRDTYPQIEERNAVMLGVSPTGSVHRALKTLG